MAGLADYRHELAGLVALPDRMSGSLLDFARRLRVRLEEEQAKPNPDNALIAVLCDAGRLGDEFLCYSARATDDCSATSRTSPARSKLQPGRVSIGERGLYQALLHWERWNGFGIPYFEKEEVDRYLSDAQAENVFEIAEYEEEHDLYRLKEPDDEAPWEFERLPNGLFCIGGWAWAWFVESEEP